MSEVSFQLSLWLKVVPENSISKLLFMMAFGLHLFICGALSTL